MAGEREREKLLEQLRDEAELVRRINEDTGGYIEFVKKIKAIKSNIAYLEKQISKATGEQKDILEEELRQVKELEVRYKRIAKETSNIVKAQEFSASALQTSKNLLGGITSAYGSIVSYTRYLAEIDKKIKMSALNMGILDTQTKSFRKSLADAGRITNEFGINQGQLAEMQAAYTEEMGRTVMLGKDGLVAIGAMAAATGLGAEGAAKMAADFELIGYSAERTGEFIDQTMNDSSKMGLNASKVVKAISNNIKLLNKYNFKGGVAGLKKMAETTTRLGVDMNFATGMAEKLFDIEGAVQMSAQLQVLGGSFSNLADPFHLMYMARNDVAGLTEEIGKAVEQSVEFNSKTGEFDMSGLELHRLRKIAEQTGIAFEDLVTAGKNAKKFSMIEGQVSFSIGDEEKEFLMNTAKLDKNGKAYIEVNGEKKFLSALGKSGNEFIKKQMEEKKSLAERAESAQTFDETITNFINGVKELFLPIMPVLDVFAKELVKSFKPAVEKLAYYLKNVKFEDYAKKLVSFAETIGGYVKWFIDNPGLGIGSAILGIGLLEGAKWFASGLSFGAGFNLATMKNLGPMIQGAFSFVKPLLGGLTRLAGTLAGIAAILGAAKDIFDFASDEKTRNTGFGGFFESFGGSGMSLLESVGEDSFNPLKYVNKKIGLSVENMGTDNLANARAIYRKKYPNAPTVIPNKDLFSDIRGNPNDYTSDIVDDASDVTINDGIIKFNPKDKFMKLNDATMIAGTDAGGNRALAEAMNSNGNMIHRFDELKISGDIKISLPGGNNISTGLISDPTFIKNMTRLVNIQISENINGKL
jgi:hypothetical protein